VHILEPRDGIGGHCLPKDTKMFLQSSKSIKSKILTAAMEVDQDFRTNYRLAKEQNINKVAPQQREEDCIPISVYSNDSCSTILRFITQEKTNP
jgi:UDP-N-acetyl-D-mannosaminuronate dehydrogenase